MSGYSPNGKLRSAGSSNYSYYPECHLPFLYFFSDSHTVFAVWLTTITCRMMCVCISYQATLLYTKKKRIIYIVDANTGVRPKIISVNWLMHSVEFECVERDAIKDNFECTDRKRNRWLKMKSKRRRLHNELTYFAVNIIRPT